MGLDEELGSGRVGRRGTIFCLKEEPRKAAALSLTAAHVCFAGQRLTPQRKLVCRFRSCLFKSRKKKH